MNNQDRKDINELKVEVKNISQAMEKLLTNDIPHLYKAVSYIKGRMSVLVPLVMALVVGFVAIALKIAGVY